MSMRWDESYATGVDLVDDQHRELFRQLGILADPDRADRVEGTLDFLAKYVREHFETEERMQFQFGFPHANVHKKMHDTFVIVLARLRHEHTIHGDNPDFRMRLTRTVGEWLTNHILKQDKMFGDFYKKSRVK